MSGSDWIGTLGVSLLLVAFALIISKKISPVSKLYLWLNVAGAGLAGISAYMINFWPFVILESVWVLATFYALLKPNSDEVK